MAESRGPAAVAGLALVEVLYHLLGCAIHCKRLDPIMLAAENCMLFNIVSSSRHAVT
jgi:hypothetical protein